MLEVTDTDFACSDDKKRARLNLIYHFLSLLPYEALKRDKVRLPNRDKNQAYDDEAMLGVSGGSSDCSRNTHGHGHARISAHDALVRHSHGRQRASSTC